MVNDDMGHVDTLHQQQSQLQQMQQMQTIPIQPMNFSVNAIGEGGTTDDDFFHLICHIESSLKDKIERGEYVDLDKLLPKDKYPQGGMNDDEHLEWVHRDGGTFLVPARKQSRISSFRKWEQAFRVFATIYCGKNPNRAREIWQYISVINTAASSFVWDNVYHYDMMFRQLMQFNPNKSWAITYNHMWNLSMRDLLLAKNVNVNKSFGNGNQQVSFRSNERQNNNKRGKPSYCWNFNKGLKCKFRAKCRFIERCSYCDSPAHGIINCHKLDKEDKDNITKKM